MTRANVKSAELEFIVKWRSVENLVCQMDMGVALASFQILGVPSMTCATHRAIQTMGVGMKTVVIATIIL